MQRSAKPILTKWRNQIENHRFQRDQKALASCLQPNEAIIMPEEYLMFPIQKDIEGGVVSTFVHITFGGRQQGQHRLYKIGPYLSKAFSVKFTKHPHVFINNFIDDLFYLIKRKYSLLKNYLKTLINTSA